MKDAAGIKCVPDKKYQPTFLKRFRVTVNEALCVEHLGIVALLCPALLLLLCSNTLVTELFETFNDMGEYSAQVSAFSLYEKG